MTVNSALMKAILSMDAYNRGYNAGINLTSDQLGTVKIAKAIVDGIEVNLDSSAIFRDPVTHAPLDDDISFYGIAYELASGEKVISYRGTDDLGLLSGDPWYGWGLGGGSTSSDQGKMAIEFYQAIAGAGNWTDANISLTGHSLGGGLAGLVEANDNEFCFLSKVA